MAISKEIKDTIINFSPSETVEEKAEIDLGSVGDARIIYGAFSYQRRVIAISGEPLIFDYTKQPVIALRRGEKLTPLPYSADIERLGEPLATQVAKQLKSA